MDKLYNPYFQYVKGGDLHYGRQNYEMGVFPVHSKYQITGLRYIRKYRYHGRMYRNLEENSAREVSQRFRPGVTGYSTGS